MDWQSLTQSSPSEDQTAARRVWLMVTDGDCWSRPSSPIVQQHSRDAVMDSRATPFITLSHRWASCHPQAPTSASDCISVSALMWTKLFIWIDSFNWCLTYRIKGIHKIQWRCNSTTNEIPRVTITAQHPLTLCLPALMSCKYVICSQQWRKYHFFIVIASVTTEYHSFSNNPYYQETMYSNCYCHV